MYRIYKKYVMRGEPITPAWNIRGRPPLATEDEFLEAVGKYRKELPPGTNFDMKHTKTMSLQLQECKQKTQELVSLGNEEISAPTVTYDFNLARDLFPADGLSTTLRKKNL